MGIPIAFKGIQQRNGLMGGQHGFGRAGLVNMNVRTSLAALAPEHLEACLCLDQASLGGLWNRAQWQSELAEQRRPGVGLWQGQQLLAMASGWLVVDELHITVVAVDPQQRRRGLGQQVLKALLLEAGQQGALHATLEVAPANTAAVALYRRLGFRDAGVRRGYYRNGEDALIQWLRLSELNDA